MAITTQSRILQFGQGSPAVLLVAGIHGDEKTGTAVLERLLRLLPNERLKGTVTLIPVANPVASTAGTRLHPFDRRDLNREFMGQGESGATPALARFLEAIALCHDLVIDLHVFPHQIMPIVGVFLPEGFLDARRRSFYLLSLACPEVIWVLDTDQKEPKKKGSICSFALQHGIPAFGFELAPEEEFSEQAMSDVCSGILALLRDFGVIGFVGNDATSSPVKPLCYERLVHRGQVSGMFIPILEPLANIQIGETIGKLQCEEKAIAIQAHRDGILLTVSRPRHIAQGDKLYTIGTRVPIPV